MDHYLFIARSVTHAQRMAQELARRGVGVKLRRVGNTVTKNGCGYTLQISERHFPGAVDTLRASGLRPVRVLHYENGETHEVAM